MPSEPRAPIRQATRIMNEFQLLATTAGLAAVGRNLDRASVLMAVLRAALRATDRPAISANALAASLQRPVESIRRHMQTLVERGLCRIEERRFVPAADLLAQPEVCAFSAETLSLYRAALGSAVSSGLDIAPAAATQADTPTLVAALDVLLGIYELSEAPPSNSMDLYVIGAIAVLNAAAITHDPVLSQRYAFAETVPPDHLRCPATPHDVAAIAGLSYATVWRHVTALAKNGALVADGGGYLLAKQWIDDPATSRRSLDRVLHFARVARRLVGTSDIVAAATGARNTAPVPPFERPRTTGP